MKCSLNLKKMKSIFLFTTLLLVSLSAFSQHNFLYEQTDLNTIRKHEDSVKSENLGFVKTMVAKDYFPTAKEGHDYYPLSFVRTNDNFYPTLHIKYYYSENDSTLLASSYDWNIMDYVDNLKKDGNKFEKEKKRKKEYLAKYKSIKSELVAKYGNPSSTEETSDSSDYFYKLMWNNDNNDILVLLKFSKKLKYLPGNMKIGSYNIRVKIDYK